MNTSVPKNIIESLGGIIDTVKPLEESLKQHEMRPFDIEPNYYEDLIQQKKSHANSEKWPDVGTKSEFLKKTLTEKNFATNFGTIISASPFRAVLRRKDYNA